MQLYIHMCLEVFAKHSGNSIKYDPAGMQDPNAKNAIPS